MKLVDLTKDGHLVSVDLGKADFQQWLTFSIFAAQLGVPYYDIPKLEGEDAEHILDQLVHIREHEREENENLNNLVKSVIMAILIMSESQSGIIFEDISNDSGKLH